MAKKTLNLGCGDRTYKEYPEGYTCINFDSRANLEVVDVVGDVRDLSMFKDGEFDYILASDILEHFPISETEKLLREWSRVLVRFGTLEIRTPNMKWAAWYYAKTGDAKFVSYHIFGGQDHSGNFHYVMFDVKWLSDICVPLGFEVIEVKEIDSNIFMKLNKTAGGFNFG